MEKLTYYLAIGLLRSSCSRGHTAHVTVLARNGEYRLSSHEEVLWKVLSCKPLTYEKMNAEYKARLDELGMGETVSFEECFRRLCELELIISGDGEYEIEAWYEIMRDILIIPYPERIPWRVRISRKRLSEQEAEVMALVQTLPLTTAQLIMAVECKSWSAETMDSVTDSLDCYGKKAMKVYAEMMYSSPSLERVLDAVFALRKDMRIICMK